MGVRAFEIKNDDYNKTITKDGFVHTQEIGRAFKNRPKVVNNYKGLNMYIYHICIYC